MAKQPKMQRIEQARAKLLVKHIFYAIFVLNTKWIVDNTIPTAATDMKVVYYNEEFINSLETDVVMFVIVHEIMHMMFKHGLRRRGRDMDRWNIACDHAINIILKDAGFSLWPHAYCDVKFRGMGAEEIYDILEDEDKKQNGGASKPCDGGFGGGDLKDPPLMDEVEAAEVERKIDQNMAQAVAQAAGNIPKALDIIIKSLLDKRESWEDHLREFMTRISHDDESWSRRNRRFTMILPTRWSMSMGEVVIIGDTSGSMMMAKVLDKVAAQINQIVEQTKPERTRVVWADAQDCNLEEVFEEGEEIFLNPKGGGGTDMRLPLAFVEQYGPEVVLLITDGETPWPKEPTPYPLIVACTTKRKCPEWASVVRLS